MEAEYFNDSEIKNLKKYGIVMSDIDFNTIRLQIINNKTFHQPVTMFLELSSLLFNGIVVDKIKKKEIILDINNNVPGISLTNNILTIRLNTKFDGYSLDSIMGNMLMDICVVLGYLIGYKSHHDLELFQKRMLIYLGFDML
jgi:hypothetical protein